ncbi:ATP-binding protein [Streptomyces piniterrae]|uniref:ATP-binding protein n=1 Tax=Streptomyces piniterrae TaxID=2571125 RepID=A0A4U0NN17_9ACTN|nr:ATP-binding protein [Streptomyces piniterrae]TJZ55807.1 ATP-binding protein [Streptomyces piniterrae]
MHPFTATVARKPIRISAGARPYLLTAPNQPTAPKAARDFVRAVLSRTNLSPLLDTAILLTSEAVTHSHLRAPESTDILLRILTTDDALRISVHDEAPADVPVPAGELGHCLLLLGHLADRWGTTPFEGPARSTSLWFELYADGAGSA